MEDTPFMKYLQLHKTSGSVDVEAAFRMYSMYKKHVIFISCYLMIHGISCSFLKKKKKE